MCEHRFRPRRQRSRRARRGEAREKKEKTKKVIIDIHHLPIERNGTMPHRGQQVACTLNALGVRYTDAGSSDGAKFGQTKTNIKYIIRICSFCPAKWRTVWWVRPLHSIPMRQTNVFGVIRYIVLATTILFWRVTVSNGRAVRLPIRYFFGYKHLTHGDIGSTSFASASVRPSTIVLLRWQSAPGTRHTINNKISDDRFD